MPNINKISGAHGFGFGGAGYRSSDPLRNQTVLHIDTLGARRGEGNLQFVDESVNRFSVTRNGNTSPSTFSPYGDSWSNYFDGSGDYLSIANNTALQFGSGDFTFECWFYIAGNSDVGGGNARDATIYGFHQNGVKEFDITITGNSTTTGTGIQIVYWFGSHLILESRSTSISQLTWHHLAVSRSGTTCRIFLNGIQLGSSFTSSANIESATPYTIGSWNHTLSQYKRYLNGYISNLRIVKGSALYTANFTPSKTPLTAVSGTSLLTCAFNRFRDLSSNNFTITPNGNVSVKSASPFRQPNEYKMKQHGYCVNFNGSQYIQTPNASAANGLQLGTSDFTIECWVKAKPQSAAYNRIIDTGAYLNPNYAFILWAGVSTTDRNAYFEMYSGNSVNYVGMTLPNVLVNSWKHIAIVRSGNTLSGYVDGILIQELQLGVNSRNLNYTTPITIGVYKDPNNANAYYNYFSGKISNVMIVKTALYNGNFTPKMITKTAQPHSINASLIACTSATYMSNETSYNWHPLTLGGSPTADSDGPFTQDDELSYYFDGNGDYLSIADNAALEIGSGDFAIEAWINTTSLNSNKDAQGAGYSAIVSKNVSTYGFFIAQDSSSPTWNYLLFHIREASTTWYTTSANYAPGFQLNTWYHVAVTRQSGTLRFFVNGSLIGTQSFAYTAENNTQALMIGGTAAVSTHFFTGYISNFRLVTGAALYTANFTPSRKPIGIASSGTTPLITCRGRSSTTNDGSAALSITVNGNTGVSAISSPFRKIDATTIISQATSQYFDGVGDYLSIPYNSAFDFGTGDFTVEGWFYMTGDSSRDNSGNGNRNSTIIAGTNAANTTVFAVYISGDSTSSGLGLYVEGNSGGYGSAGAVFSRNIKNEWHHLAITRASGTIRVFLDGQQQGSNVTFTKSLSMSSQPLWVGMMQPTAWQRPYFGFMSGLRVANAAYYTSNFTPNIYSMLPHPGTRLALSSQGGFFDTTRRNAIEQVGNTTTSGGPPNGKVNDKYAIYFDGSADYLSIPSSPDFDFGTGDFTIETWAFIAANSAADPNGNKPASIISCYASSTQGWIFSIGGNASTTGNGLWFEGQNSGVYFGSSTPAISISQSTWHHIAVARKNGVIRFFLNGVQQGSDINFTTALSSGGGRAIIGGHSIASWERYLNGFLHELRVTKGVARYTSNFTVPRQFQVK